MLRLAKEARLSSISREIDRKHALAMSIYKQAEQDDPFGQPHEQGADKMATVLSMINMKGGVGKTTLAMHLAHAADLMNLRTLAVDLDPQSNLSQVLMGPKAYVEYIEAGKPTVVQIFDGYAPTDSTRGSPRPLNV